MPKWSLSKTSLASKRKSPSVRMAVGVKSDKVKAPVSLWLASVTLTKTHPFNCTKTAMNTITKLEYDIHRNRINRYEETRNRLYPGVCCFTPEMIDNIVRTAGITSSPTNEERSVVEVYEFVNDPPDRYFAYINEKTRTCNTWMGDKLGEVGFGRAYRSNMGDIRVPITVYGINGKKYHGYYYKSAGDYCRIRLAKKA